MVAMQSLLAYFPCFPQAPLFTSSALLWDILVAEQVFLRTLPGWSFSGLLLHSILSAAEEINLSLPVLIFSTKKILLSSSPGLVFW